MMKIAIIGSKGIPPKFGGFETFVYELTLRLNGKNNIEFVIYCEDLRKNTDIFRDYYNGIKRVFIPRKNKIDLIKSRIIAFDDAINFEKVDTILLLGYIAAPFVKWKYLRKKNIKIIVNPDGLEWKRSKYSFFTRRFLKFCEKKAILSADKIVADSLEIKKYIEKKYSTKKCSFIPYGYNTFFDNYDSSFFNKLNILKKEYFIFIGRCVKENNIDLIVNGFKRSKTNKKLLIVTNFSNDKYSKYIKRICKEDKRIILSPALYDNEKIFSLRFNSFAYIHGHSVGGTNPSLIESMGCGNSIIAHNNVFNREVISEKLGFFFSNENDLSSIIDNFIEDKNRGIEIKKRASDYYNWNKVVDCYLNVFWEVGDNLEEDKNFVCD